MVEEFGKKNIGKVVTKNSSHIKKPCCETIKKRNSNQSFFPILHLPPQTFPSLYGRTSLTTTTTTTTTAAAAVLLFNLKYAEYSKITVANGLLCGSRGSPTYIKL